MGLIASEQGIKSADEARIKRGYPIKYSPALAADAIVGICTVKRFWQRKEEISVDNFKAICHVLGINWDEIVDWSGSTTPKEFLFPPSSPINISSCPFGERGCIAPTRFFNRTEILERLYEALSLGQNRSLVGESEIGKSSILWKIYQEGWQNLNFPKKAFIYLNMELLWTYEAFFTELCQKLAIKLDIRSFSFGIDLRDRLVGGRYIVCIDEMEIFKDFSYQDLQKTLRLLRGLAGSFQAPLTLITASFEPLERIFSNYGSSSLANICMQIDVNVFSEEDARQFLHHRLQGHSITFTDDQIDRLIADSNCHPARLQEHAAILYHRLNQ